MSHESSERYRGEWSDGTEREDGQYEGEPYLDHYGGKIFIFIWRGATWVFWRVLRYPRVPSLESDRAVEGLEG